MEHLTDGLKEPFDFYRQFSLWFCSTVETSVCVLQVCVCGASVSVCVRTLLVNKPQQLPLTWGIAVAHSEQFTGQNAYWEQAATVQRLLGPLVFPHGYITICFFFCFFLAGFISKVSLKSHSCGSS